MHFKTLVTVEIPTTIEDENKNQEIRETIEGLKSEKQMDKSSMLSALYLSILQGQATSFARAVDRCVEEAMEPYSANPSEEYLEFDDKTEYLRLKYGQRVDCLKLPEGKVVELCSYPYQDRFCIIDGKVYQRNAGPLQHVKRTKKTKRITALSNYPRNKVYKSFKEYAEKFCYFTFDELHQAYGYYCNPNAMWDWYQIGGRWPTMFLVKSDCMEQSPGERSLCNVDASLESPEGYIWVAAARKKDICWDVMRAWNTQKETERFYCLEKMFAAGKLENVVGGHIVENGIAYGSDYAYRKGETLDEYLERHNFPKAWKYPLNVHDIMDVDNWFSLDDCYQDTETTKYLSAKWHSQIDEYIDNIHDDDVFVGVDYHI